jgi:peroxiredoxin Q/BCP
MAKKIEAMESPWVGRKAPGFTLKDQNGKAHKLSDYAGQWVVLFMYPKDDTPGCTKEACGFGDRSAAFKKAGAAVLGMSILDEASKKKFAAKHGLKFPLLADPEMNTLVKYGVWVEKSMYGNSFMGVSRETFLIGPDGRVKAHWPKAAGNEKHSEEVLTVLGLLQELLG